MKRSVNLHHLCLVGVILATVTAQAQNESSSAPPPPVVPHLQSVHEEVEHQLAQAQKQILLAQNQYGASSGGFTDNTVQIPVAPKPPAVSFVGSPSSTPEVLLLCNTEMSPERQTELTEDLAIMTRVLERAVKDQLAQGFNRAMGLELMLLPGHTPTKAVYLEDYGVIFNLRVGYPLLPATELETTDQPETKPENTEWEAARRDLYGGAPGGPGDPYGASMALRLHREEATSGPYNEEQVQQLQESLFTALRNTDQIRHLGANDHVLIYVEGAAPGPAKPGHQVHVENRVVNRSTGSKDQVMVWSGSSSPRVSGTIMTVRVKVADARGLSTGMLDLDEFRERASVRIYSTNPEPGD